MVGIIFSFYLLFRQGRNESNKWTMLFEAIQVRLGLRTTRINYSFGQVQCWDDSPKNDIGPRKPHQATLAKHSESQIEKNKCKCCLYIYEAMHKVHTHLLTEESPGCQPLLLLCRKDTQESFLFRGWRGFEFLLRQLAETETIDLGDDLFAQRIWHPRSQPYSSCRTRSST